jgi:hypothetical protein
VAALLQDRAAREVAQRARGLSPTALETVAALIDNLRALESTPKRRTRASARP